MNSSYIDSRPLSYVNMYKWEDEKWSTVHLTAGYSRNDGEEIQPYMVIPASKGKFRVYLECEGFMAVKSIGGKADGCWAGLMAYDSTKSGWSVSEYVGAKITNIQANTNFVCGHPDVKLNDCTFKKNRGIECDFVCSFHLDCDDEDGKWLLYPPPVQKSDDFNYIVSYSNFTDKWLEWGMISISIDEINSPSSLQGLPRRRLTQQLTTPEGQPDTNPAIGEQATGPAPILSPNPALGEEKLESIQRWLSFSPSDSEQDIPAPPDPERPTLPQEVFRVPPSNSIPSVIAPSLAGGSLRGSLFGGSLKPRSLDSGKLPETTPRDNVSVAGSLTGSLVGGSLRGGALKSPRLDTAQAKEHARILKQLGKTAAAEYLERVRASQSSGQDFK
ncbi:hypothetical protein 3 [Changjiang polero-like virus 1]|uniref:hypothetical protein 3 n=1 Tax=Changjiang polero-like virus 1 TaxID=1922799 RepID=UPI00090BB382|nr:hypothetical protein 3 [Changjiang polero-like virus 1]APG75730.1 hypothetical protein 3 [Changjiang polero-like virus 1]